MSAVWFDQPYSVDARGRSATTGADDHVRDLIAAVLFTSPGERVMHPDFGCGLRQLVFAPNSDLLATATEDEGVSAFQAYHLKATPTQLDEQLVDLGLADLFARDQQGVFGGLRN